MKKALVCGAGGFIGGHLVKKLKKRDTGLEGLILKNMNLHQHRQMSFYSWTCVWKIIA